MALVVAGANRVLRLGSRGFNGGDWTLAYQIPRGHGTLTGHLHDRCRLCRVRRPNRRGQADPLCHTGMGPQPSATAVPATQPMTFDSPSRLPSSRAKARGAIKSEYTAREEMGNVTTDWRDREAIGIERNCRWRLGGSDPPCFHDRSSRMGTGAVRGCHWRTLHRRRQEHAYA